MKKYMMLFLVLIMVVCLSGCDSKEKTEILVCTTKESEDGMDMEQVVSMTYKNDTLNHMTMEVNTTITDKQIQKNWSEFKKSMDSNNEEFTKEGVTFTIDVDDKNYEYNTKLDIDIDATSEEVLKEQGFEGLKDDNSTLESSKQDAIEGGAVCVVK